MALLSFDGRIGRVPYVLGSAAAFFSQHAAVWIACRSLNRTPALDAVFWIAPLRSLVTQANASDVVLILGFAYFLLVGWVLAVLTFRRAADADLSEALAAAAMAPIVQIPVMLFFASMPPRVSEVRPLTDLAPRSEGYSAAVVGVVAGVGLTLAAVAVSTLVFHAYGAGLFVVSPFVIGAATAYFGNRRVDIGGGATAQLVIVATFIGGVGLVMVALEGVICIVLASPLALGIALIGGLLGRAIARAGKRAGRHLAPSFALLPIVFALESVFAVPTHFDTEQRIVVAAPPAVVWQAVLHMRRMDEPPALPFRLGVAYPLSGDVSGEGVGAIRRGEFSTGVAVERVTEWITNRRLSFVVLKDVPALRELSPYGDLHTPHTVGYFTTSLTTFEIEERQGGGVEVVLKTSHDIRLDPILYWMPMAHWIVQTNNARVLAHLRRQAEGSRAAMAQ